MKQKREFHGYYLYIQTISLTTKKNTNFIEFYGFFSQRENFYVLGSDLQGRFYLPYSQQVVHKVYPNQIEPVDPLERAYEYLADIMYHLLHMMILNRKEWYD